MLLKTYDHLVAGGGYPAGVGVGAGAKPPKPGSKRKHTKHSCSATRLHTVLQKHCQINFQRFSPRTNALPMAID